MAKKPAKSSAPAPATRKLPAVPANAPAPDVVPAATSPLARYAVLLPLLGFGIALALRLWGIDWSLPTQTRAFTYHPDEGTIILAALNTNPFAGDFDPNFYNYGSLTILLDSVLIRLFEAVGFIGASVNNIPSPGAFLVARFVTAFLGAGTCLPLFYLGRMLYGSAGAGVVAALLYAVAPLAVQHGHFATVDVPATFFVTMSLCFAVRRTTTDGAPCDLRHAGIFAGLAAATKYNAGLVLLSCVAVWFLLAKSERSPKELAVAFLSAFLAFLVAMPAAVLNPWGVGKAIVEESQHVAGGHGDVFAQTAPGFVHHITENLAWGMGVPLTLLAFAGIVYRFSSPARRTKGDIVLGAFAIVYYVLIGLAQVKFARYTLPLFPPLVLWASSFFALKNGTLQRQNLPTSFPAALPFAVFVPLMFLQSRTLIGEMLLPDNRDLAAQYISSQNVQTVGCATGPWFHSPPFDPYFSAPYPPIAKQATERTQSPRVLPAVGEWNVEQLRRESPDIVTLTEIGEYGDAIRIRKPAALAYIAELQKNYRISAIFENGKQREATGGDNDLGNFPRRVGRPHDMQYVNPTVVVFSKR